MDEATAGEIVDRLMVDLWDREGLGDELERVSNEQLRAMQQAWAAIILEGAS